MVARLSRLFDDNEKPFLQRYCFGVEVDTSVIDLIDF
jgi:hypothetical protein